MNGILLLALGAAWNELRLPHPVRVTAYCFALYGTYANWLVTLIAAAFGTAANSPITSAGQSGQPWQESLVAIGFLTVTIAIIALTILFSGVFEERPPRSTIVGTAGSIRNSTFPDRWKDAHDEPADRTALEAQSSGSIARQQTLAGQFF
jgi:hypothetical protein